MRVFVICSFDTSFFPSTVRLWNELNLSMRDSKRLSDFKAKLCNYNDKVDDVLGISKIKFNVVLTRIRHNCSDLNDDLCRVNI